MSATMPAPTTAEGLRLLSDEATRERDRARGRYVQVAAFVVLAVIAAAGRVPVVFWFLVICAAGFAVNGGTHTRRARELELTLKIAMIQVEADDDED